MFALSGWGVAVGGVAYAFVAERRWARATGKSLRRFMATYGGEPDLYVRGLRLWRDVFSTTALANTEADDARLAIRRATFVFGAGIVLFATGVAIGFLAAPDA